MQNWFSAQDIADLVKCTGFKHFPSSKRRIQDFAKREEWAANGDLFRKRKVRGGGLEYHISLLPDMLQDVALAGHNKQIIKQDQ